MPSDLVPLDMTVFAPSKLGDKKRRLIFLANASQRDRRSQSGHAIYAIYAILDYSDLFCVPRHSKTTARINLPGTSWNHDMEAYGS